MIIVGLSFEMIELVVVLIEHYKILLMHATCIS